MKAIPKALLSMLNKYMLKIDTSSLQISMNYLNISLTELSISNKKLRHATLTVGITASEICGRNFWNKLDIFTAHPPSTGTVAFPGPKYM